MNNIRASLLDRRLRTWEGRLGRPIVEQYEVGVELYACGFVGSIFLMGAFFAASSLHMPRVAAAALVSVFCIAFPAAIIGGVVATRAMHRIPVRYGLPRSSRRTLTLQALRDPLLFDAWLKKERELLPPGQS